MEEARAILKALEETVPGLAMVRLRRVSLERRHGNLEEAEALLRDAMESAKNATETSFYAVKLSRQLMKVQRSLSKARKVLLDAIEKDQVGNMETTVCSRSHFVFKFCFIALILLSELHIHAITVTKHTAQTTVLH